MFDDCFQFVFEIGFVVGFAIFVEVESMVNCDGRIVFSAIVVETLQLDDEDFWCVADLLVLSDIADLLASVASVALNGLDNVLL